MIFKPCPFCGEVDIRISELDDNAASNGEWIIYCISCYAKISSSYNLMENFMRTKDKMKNEAISKWNRRYGVQREDTNIVKKAYYND